MEGVMAEMGRRAMLSTSVAAVGGLAVARPAASGAAQKIVKNGRLKQSVSRWCYAKIPMPEFCRAVADMGLTAIDLLQPNEWAPLKEFGLTCSMGSGVGGNIPVGFNNPANHEALIKALTDGIPLAAKAGVPNVITFFGNVQSNITEAQAIENCVTGLNRIKKVAEDNGVMLCVELLNSKVNHKGYQGDHTAFGVQVIKGVDSPRVKLLYDIYHMQIMEGDVISTIRQNINYIAHFHTGGVPGRHELDDTQELNWAAVSRAIVDTGYKGYLAHEFVPTRDPLTSLRDAVTLCDV
jgi:hydroxypyruvate isomerase